MVSNYWLQVHLLILFSRGTQTSRFVKCYSSHPNEMQIHPTDAFMLAPNALQVNVLRSWFSLKMIFFALILMLS